MQEQSNLFIQYILLKLYCQIPHTFQEILASETTPTLCYSLPAFNAFIQLWTGVIKENPDWETVIQPGLDKLVN